VSDTISSPSAGDSTVRKRKFIEYYPYPKDAIYFEAYEAKGWGRHYNMGIGTLELRKKGSRLSLSKAFPAGRVMFFNSDFH
jgi:hypothetical protein